LDSRLAVNAAKLVILAEVMALEGGFFIASPDEEKSIHQSF
jgi:hypothetical protein